MYWVYFIPNEYFQQYSIPSSQISMHNQKSCPSQMHSNSYQQSNQQKLFLELTAEDLQQAGYEVRKRVWTQAEDQKLLFLRDKKQLDWPDIANKLPQRNSKMCYSRYRRLENRTKQVWTDCEDRKLVELVQKRGEKWDQISCFFPKRTIKQIRQRYANNLHPSLNKQKWTLEQDLNLVNLINQHGLQWKIIQQFLQGRNQNQIKNRYFGRLKPLNDKKERKNTLKSQFSQK